MDLKDAIEFIQDTSTASERETVISISGDREFIYNDGEAQYVEVDRFVAMTGSVSTVESFAELVMEQARRFALRSADDAVAKGHNQTVTFTENGGIYSPDDEDGRHRFEYKRQLSQQWKQLIATLGKPLTHKQLIRALQSLSPSIVDYPLVIAAFRRLVVSKDIKLASEPIINDDGNRGEAYTVQLSIKGGTAETNLPTKIDMRLAYTRGGEEEFTVPVEVDLSDNDGVPVITLFAPTLAAVADDAVMHEMRWFEHATSKLDQLLLVVNF